MTHNLLYQSFRVHVFNDDHKNRVYLFLLSI